jgi:hypothetical protein
MNSPEYKLPLLGNFGKLLKLRRTTGARGNRGFSSVSQGLVLFVQLLFSLHYLRVEDDAVHRAYFHALRLFVMPDAFGAKVGVYFIDLLTL